MLVRRNTAKDQLRCFGCGHRVPQQPLRHYPMGHVQCEPAGGTCLSSDMGPLCQTCRQVVALAHNSFSGTLWSILPEITTLRTFLVNDNCFSGTLPSLQKLYRCVIQAIQRDALTATCRLRAVTTNNNDLTGTLTLPDHAPELEILFVNTNRLSCPIKHSGSSAYSPKLAGQNGELSIQGS